MDIDPAVKDLIDRYAAAAGVRQWAVIEAAVRAGVPGPNGIPEGWVFPEVPAPSRRRRRELGQDTEPHVLFSFEPAYPRLVRDGGSSGSQTHGGEPVRRTA